MIIGQAAGVAASLAIRGRTPVQEISIANLQQRLRDHHAVLHIEQEFSLENNSVERVVGNQPAVMIFRVHFSERPVLDFCVPGQSTLTGKSCPEGACVRIGDNPRRYAYTVGLKVFDQYDLSRTFVTPIHQLASDRSCQHAPQWATHALPADCSLRCGYSFNFLSEYPCEDGRSGVRE